jgi:serine/threonine-protein phosphatase 2B catalytic subunit
MTIGQTQLERAIYEIQHRANVPQLDFSQHQLDNGYTISTRERVVKEVRRLAASYSLCGEGTIVRLGSVWNT